VNPVSEKPAFPILLLGDSLVGYLDAVEPAGLIRGWAHRTDGSKKSVAFAVVADGREVCTFVADAWRPDLASLRNGDGSCGFAHQLPSELLDGKPHQISLCLAGTSVSLLAKPLTIELAARGPEIPQGPAALGSLDEIHFLDAMLRDADPASLRSVPSGTQIALSGWIALSEPLRPPAHVFAELDSVRFGLLAGFERIDVAHMLESPALKSVGFRGLVSLAGVPGGSYALRVVAVDEHGNRQALAGEIALDVRPSAESFPGTTLLEPDSMRIVVDCVAPETSAEAEPAKTSLACDRGDALLVRGWAVDLAAGAPLSGIYALVDGTQYVMGVHGYSRPDVASAVGMPGCRRSGYRIRIGTSHLGIGEHSLALCAIGAEAGTYGAIDVGEIAIRDLGAAHDA
jgi:hypothetical protein